MDIQVLFFGATADWVGHRELTLSINNKAATADVVEQLISQYSLLKDRKLKIAVNQQYAKGNEIIRDGDELAIFTAVSGG